MEIGNQAIAKLLLEKGADPDFKNSEYHGRTPLSRAAKMGNEAVVKLLLEKGVEPDSKDARGQTPWSWAAKNGHKAVEKGADNCKGPARYSNRRTFNPLQMWKTAMPHWGQGP